MSATLEMPRRRRRPRLWLRLLAAAAALLASYVAGMLVAAAINPGFDLHLYYFKAAVPALLVAAALALASARLFGAGTAVAAVVAVAVVSGMTAVVFAQGYAAQPDRAADEARNLAFLRTFEHPRGSALVESETYATYPSGDSFEVGFLNPYTGYSTRQTWLLPRGTNLPDAVVFYRRELRRHGWATHVEVDCTGVSDLESQCGRDVWASRDGEYVKSVFIYYRPDGRLAAVV
jgi:hypothetical protein